MDLREEALALIEQAAAKLEKAGIRELLPHLAYKVAERGEHWAQDADGGYAWAESFECSICGYDHYATFILKRPKEYNYQMGLEVELVTEHRNCSLRIRIGEGLREFWGIVRDRESTQSVAIHERDLPKLKDLVRYL